MIRYAIDNCVIDGENCYVELERPLPVGTARTFIRLFSQFQGDPFYGHLGTGRGRLPHFRSK